MSSLGPVITGRDVEAAMNSTIKLWQADYLAEVAAHSGRQRGDLPLFASFTTAFNLDKFEEDQTPACVVIAPGTTGTPQRTTRGYIATWAVGVGGVVSGQSSYNTYELASLYAAAIRMLVLQHPSLGGFAEGSEWVGERYDDLSTEDLRTIAAGTVQFNVTVLDVVDQTQGHSQPSDDATIPPADWPTVETVDVQVTSEG